jgi:nucleotide-binding universal stress UspA family protein
MRILLAVDGSLSSDRATELVSTFPLPPESVIRVVAVQQPFVDVLAMSWASVGESGVGDETEEEQDARHLKEAIERAEIALKRPDLTLEGILVRGRPASAIVDEAAAMEADLVIVGSRGHGTIATMVLGSTASEVVDHAPCPVLVARSGTLGTVALADDGSPSARTAESVVSAWPLFADREICIVGVAEVGVPVAAGFTPGLYDQVLESYTRSVDDARQQVAETSQAVANRLSDAGRMATTVVLDGDPAAEIVRYATERGTGTIVMGTRGRTGLARLLLGSVARKVLVHAPCSVLIVRERP